MKQAEGSPESQPLLPKKWFFLLIVLGFLAWASVGAMGLMPLWLWVVLIAALICAALLVALFAPRTRSKVKSKRPDSASAAANGSTLPDA